MSILLSSKEIDTWRLERNTTHVDINHYHLDGAFDGELLETISKIVAALNTDNHDRSDIQTDYFDVGHYVKVQVGRWNKPFVVSAQ